MAKSTLDIITDPVTKKQFFRDTSVVGSTYAPYTGSGNVSTSNAQRSLAATSNSPSGAVKTGRTLVSNAPATPDPITGFNNALAGLLKRHQKMGTKKFAEQEFDATEAQIKRVSARTSDDLIGSSPTLQSNVRSAASAALTPTISGAQKSQQTFGEQIDSIGTAIENARQFAKDYEATQQSLRQEARSNLLLAVELGGAAGLDAIKKENPNIFKIAGLDEETLIASAKDKEQKEAESKKTFTPVDLGDRIGIFDNQGNLISTTPKGVTPSGPDEGDIEKAQAKQDLLSLLGQYRTELAGSNTLSRFLSPSKTTQLNTLKGQITATYKKQQQLGTLDAGVQKLIDSIVPGAGLNVGNLSTDAQLRALDNFIMNQGGILDATSGTGSLTGQTPSGLKYQILP